MVTAAVIMQVTKRRDAWLVPLFRILKVPSSSLGPDRVFVVFHSSPSQVPKQYLKSGPDRFLAHPFQLNIQYSSNHFTQYGLNY
jgi:hypothetical protein